MRAKEEEKTVKITMDRDTLGPDAKPGAPDILLGPRVDKETKAVTPGTTHTVPENFARFCIWKKKAHATTPEDEKAVKKTGPITSEDFAGKKSTR